MSEEIRSGPPPPAARAELIGGLRRLAKPRDAANGNGNGSPVPGPEEHCDLCGTPLPPQHRHLLELEQRRILCACETCLNTKSAEPNFRPAGTRVVICDDLQLEDELWARLGIPIGLVFFTLTGAESDVYAFYPSPAGPTECELDLDAWDDLCAANPILANLEPDAEALVVNRVTDTPTNAIVPIDECYRLVGMIKASWEGISGGQGPDEAIESFFAELRQKAVG